MKILQRLTELSDEELQQMNANAVERLTGPLRDQAEAVIAAVNEELSRRVEAKRLGKAATAKRIRDKVAGLGLQARVETAFADLPSIAWERAAIKALADNPGASTEDLSKVIGYSGVYMNWFGHVCRDREPWLGPAQPGANGKIVYSTLMVDFTPRISSNTGGVVTGWKMKDEALSALKAVGVLRN